MMFLHRNDMAVKSLMPFFSVLMIITSLFITAFFKMTLRRVSYSLYRESGKFDEIQDEYYKNLMEYGRISLGDRLEKQAQRRFLEEVKKGQIIQVINGKAVVTH